MRRLTTSAYGDVTYSNDWHIETACFQYANTEQRVSKFYIADCLLMFFR